jgi:hypothetical protein
MNDHPCSRISIRRCNLAHIGRIGRRSAAPALRVAARRSSRAGAADAATLPGQADTVAAFFAYTVTFERLRHATTRGTVIGAPCRILGPRHIEHIYAKTGVSNRAQLSLFALKHGLMAGPQS